MSTGVRGSIDDHRAPFGATRRGAARSRSRQRDPACRRSDAAARQNPSGRRLDGRRTIARIEILTVCTGNVCRSPMAEAFLRRDLAVLGRRRAGQLGRDRSATAWPPPRRSSSSWTSGASTCEPHRSRRSDAGPAGLVRPRPRHDPRPRPRGRAAGLRLLRPVLHPQGARPAGQRDRARAARDEPSSRGSSGRRRAASPATTSSPTTTTSRTRWAGASAVFKRTATEIEGLTTALVGLAVAARS